MSSAPLQLDTLDQITDCHDALADGATLVTANNRLARHLRSRFERSRVAAGLDVWPTPAVVPWATWLRQFHAGLVDRDTVRSILLSSLQELLVWQQVISNTVPERVLMRPEAAAETAATAYSLVRNWHLSHTQLSAGAGGETEAFLEWIARFEQICRARGWLAQADLIPVVIAAIAARDLNPPPRLILAGFDQLTTAQAALLAALADAGTGISVLADAAAAQQAHRYAAVDRDQEIAICARWAWSRLRAAPHTRINIVVPDLGKRRAAIDRWFKAILHPETGVPGPRPRQPLFEFSLGEPLASYPVVHDALLALRLLEGEQPLHAVGRFLCSPFFAGAAIEWTGRADLDARLRDQGRARLSIGRLLQALARTVPHIPHTEAALKSARTLVRGFPRKALPSAWANDLDRLLGALGWPGERQLDSDEFQTVTRFRELYSELVKLDSVSGRIGYSAAVSLLRRMSTQVVFQPESRHAPIQVLGVLEAAGTRCDHLWVMGLDDTVWPPPAAPHPLLPPHLQRRLGLPHASAEREWLFAQRLTERLRRTAPEAIFSYPLKEGDRELRASPLIAAVPELGAAQLDLLPMPADALSMPGAPLETWIDTDLAAPPATLRGGTQLLAAQASCPFSAVAAYRLRALPLSEPQTVPDGRHVGATVHRALELLWRGLENQATLLALSHADRDIAVGSAIDTALAEAQADRPDLYTTQYVALERERLSALLMSWLDVEGGRAPFSVARLEADAAIDLQGLHLRVRADRIDTLDDGTVVVIDYKTAKKTQVSDWTDPRIVQPQVPLYCIASEDAVAAGVLARLRTEGCGFTGLTRDADILPGVAAFPGTQDIADWSNLQQHWRSALGALAGEVRAGRAEATPSAQACRLCPYAALCRLYDHVQTDRDDE